MSSDNKNPNFSPKANSVTSNKIIIDNTDNPNLDVDIYNNKHTTELFINDLTEKINKLTKSDNKHEFVKNYNDYQKKIVIIDQELETPNQIDTNIDIKNLFEMLNQYENLLHASDINIKDLKKIMDLVNIIETKIKQQKMIVTEISA
jgi:hypothetical protein